MFRPSRNRKFLLLLVIVAVVVLLIVVAVQSHIGILRKIRSSSSSNNEDEDDDRDPKIPSPRDEQISFKWNLQGLGHTQRLAHPKPPPRIVWVFWFGGLHKMSKSRNASLEKIRRNIGVPVRFLTSMDEVKKLSEPEDPIHPLIFHEPQVLSSNHIVDYLRCYIMKHYGGGYLDVKPMYNSWEKYFAAFEADPDLWFVAPRQLGYYHVGCHETYMQRMGLAPPDCNKVRRNWRFVGSDACWIARPGTPFVVEFHKLINDTLNRKWQEILEHPVPESQKNRCCTVWANGDIWKPEYGEFKHPDYALRWTEMHAEAFDPLQLKWNKHVKIGLPRYADNETYL